MEEGEEQRQVAFLKCFTVFNIEQCEGISRPVAAEPSQALSERELIPHTEALIAAAGADFRIGGDEAFYVPSLDYIQVGTYVSRMLRSPLAGGSMVRRWYQLAHDCNFPRRINAIGRLTGDPYGRERELRKTAEIRHSSRISLRPLYP